MNNENSLPKSYTSDDELKSQIIYESLCENYGISVIEGVFKFLGMDKLELANDATTKRILKLLNGNK